MDKLATPVIPKYLRLVVAYESAAREYLNGALARMFDEVEPTMIDFASKAETNNAQVHFFDAIGRVRDRGEMVTRHYFNILDRGFQNFTRGQPIHYPRPIIEADTPGQPGIVDDNDLELHIAIQAMIEKSANKHHQLLYQMGQRLAVIRRGRKLTRRDIPVAPEHLAITFQQVSADFELEHRLLLILCVLFEKCVLAGLGTLYAEINSLFADAGIYPHLAHDVILIQNRAQATGERPEVGRERARSVGETGLPRARTAPLTNEDFAIGVEVFQSILSLLTERLRADPRFRNHPEHRADGNLEQLRSKPNLLQAIGRLTAPATMDTAKYAPGSASSITASTRSATTREQLRRQITGEREAIYRALDTNTIPTADLDTIELVGMLFEHVLDDPDLAPLTKALICHLHTPYLKVAILDQRFLTDPGHIARKLLNLVVNAGRRWVDERNPDAGIHHAMHELVQTIMHEFSDDIALFDSLYEQFLDNLRALEHKTRILEERTREATKGKDRLEHARRRADMLLQQHCGGVRFHPVLWRFLSMAWKHHMTLLLLRDRQAEHQRQWRTVLMVINSVIKLNNGYSDPGTLEWLRHTWPGLKKNIEYGLDFLGDINPEEYIALCDLVRELLQGRQTRPVERVTVRSDTALAAADGSGMTNAEQPTVSELRRREVQQTAIGTWFEFSGADGELQRVKQSWYSPITNNHMFIDRFGSKAFILSTDQLVSRLDGGTVRVVTPNRFPFVDQALRKIHDLLRAE